MVEERFLVYVDDVTRVSATAYAAGGPTPRGATLVLAHGAGGDQLSGFMVDYAMALADRGLDIITFNFPYAEQGRKLPDPGPRLEACYRAVIEHARTVPSERNCLFLGGKSMGGRIASQVAAASPDMALGGLVLLGYPLHPPGRPNQLRTAHLPRVKTPMLFIQGSRDTFGGPEELHPILSALPNARLWVVDAGDHSFKIPKQVGVAQRDVHASIQDEVARWVGGRTGDSRLTAEG